MPPVRARTPSAPGTSPGEDAGWCGRGGAHDARSRGIPPEDEGDCRCPRLPVSTPRRAARAIAVFAGRIVSAGGRVLSVTAVGPDLGSARERAYDGVAAVRLRGAHWRTDIARAAAAGEVRLPG